MLIRPTAAGKKLVFWHEILVLMDCSLLPEGSTSKTNCPRWERSVIILLACLRVLEVYRDVYE